MWADAFSRTVASQNGFRKFVDEKLITTQQGHVVTLVEFFSLYLPLKTPTTSNENSATVVLPVGLRPHFRVVNRCMNPLMTRLLVSGKAGSYLTRR